MNWLTRLIKSPIFHASLIGAFGGMAPKLVALVPDLLRNNLPSSGVLIAIGVLAFFGLVTVLIYGEQDLKKALALGAGAPAIIASLTTTTIGPNSSAFLMPIDFSLQQVAIGQVAHESRLTKLVVKKNESPFQTNALWLKTNRTTISRYWTKGDTVLFNLPADATELRIGFPAQTKALKLSRSDIDSSGIIHVDIVNMKTEHDFWQTFGGVRGSEYRVERKK